jgi:asparagine synthase (glutamine-hydrolysing)
VEVLPDAALGFGAIFADRWRRHDRQPFVDREMRMAVVADCRLDNRNELRVALSLNQDCTDAQLLLSAYDRWGIDTASHVVGDFAVVFWDWRRKELVALRDHVGIKPLYYWIGERDVVLATDLGLLIELVQPPPVPDDQFVVEHLLMAYRSSDRTFWRHIKRLPGGHRLVASAGRCRVTRYWRPSKEQVASSVAEIHEDLRAIFFESVECRLDSEVPLIAHLSGGLDSSSIVCVADEIYKRGPGRPPLTLASSLYPGLSCDEGEFIRAVAEQTSFDAEAWDSRAEGLSPLLSPSLLGPGMGTEKANDMKLGSAIGARVLLTGQGGDHLCSGDGVAEDIVQERPARVTINRLVGRGVPFQLRVLRARFLARQLAPMRLRRAVGQVRGYLRAPPWLRREWRALASSLAALGYPTASGSLSHVAARHWDAVGSASLGLALDSDQHRATASGMEVRHPFLDVRLIRYVLSIPFQHWPPLAPYARLHREFLGQFLPEQVVRRTKATFSVGVAYRMKLVWPRIRSLVLDGEWHAARYVDRQQARALMQRGAVSTDWDDWPLWRGIWGIAMLEAWLRKISEYSSSPKRSRDEHPA